MFIGFFKAYNTFKYSEDLSLSFDVAILYLKLIFCSRTGYTNGSQTDSTVMAEQLVVTLLHRGDIATWPQSCLWSADP